MKTYYLRVPLTNQPKPMNYTIINRYKTGMSELIPTDETSAKRLITQKAYNVETRGIYRDRHFDLDTSDDDLLGKELRVRIDKEIRR